MEFNWQQYFWCLAFLGPFLLTSSWSLSFWVRLTAGFVALSQAVSQIVLSSDDASSISEPGNPFGKATQWYLAICIASGVSGALFAAFAEPVGLLIIMLWGCFSVYTWHIVAVEDFSPTMTLRMQQPTNPWHAAIPNLIGPASPKETPVVVVCCALAICSVLFFVSRACIKYPRSVRNLLGGVFGAACGAHATVQAIYYYWNYGTTVYGLLAGNRYTWCSDRSPCKIFYITYCMLIVVSLITQYFAYQSSRPSSHQSRYRPVPFKHPNKRSMPSNGSLEDGQSSDEEEEDDNGWLAGMGEPQSETWAANLRTPKSCWIFLTVVVTVSSIATYIFSQFVKWNGDTKTNFYVGLLYVLTNAFCLWSIIEFFFTTLWFHVIRLVCDIPPLPKRDFSRGLPNKGRTFLAYCLLSKSKDASEETVETAKQAHLANLDPNMCITTGVVSVTSALSLVKHELDRRDACRNEIREILQAEMKVVCRLCQAGRLNKLNSVDAEYELRKALKTECGSGDRSCFWLVLVEHKDPASLPQVLQAKVDEAVQHFVYLHRTCKVLKKPGQYQDIMVLGSTGINKAYTYLTDVYGDMGREEGSECFGYKGNIQIDVEGNNAEVNAAIADLERRGVPDVELVALYGADPRRRYYYTMVLDSDTMCPAGSMRELVESAEHPANRNYGLINANLATDYSKDDSTTTWYMWRNALMEVSTVNLQRGQFWIFNRVGFYGKGLVRNEMYISRLIGMPGSPVEALPVDILSHDTVEAKLLQPAIASGVTLYEDVARNPISALSQSTRWMLGEVRNGCYHSDGAYRGIVKVLSLIYSICKEGKRRKDPFVRWREVPCSASAEYLSHTGFRLFHAGPSILLISILTSLLAERRIGLELNVVPVLGVYAFLFTVLALFIVPKGFLILDKLPSLGLGRFLLCSTASSKVGDRAISDHEDDKLIENGQQSLASEHLRELVEEEVSESESEEEKEPAPKLGRCSVLIRQLVLSLIEIALSVLLFSPELVVGVVRLVRGAWAQITGSAAWQPQDAVEKEVEQNLSVLYVFKKTWWVFLAGLAYLSYAIAFRIYDVLIYLLIVSWMLYPLTTYWMCMHIGESWKTTFMWKWVMEIKKIQQ